MALGFNLESNGGGGNFLPICKFDARSGRMFRRDRENGENIDVDITKTFKAVIDFENLEVGFINFNTGGAPHFAMAAYGDTMPEKPSPDHKPGVRFVAKLASACGGDVREMASNAKAFLVGVDNLHNDYLAGLSKNAGQLPVVVLADTVPVVSGEGSKRTTNYSPVFEITGWVKRPDDLGGSTRVAATPKATPPATGANKVSAPSKKAPADDEDFG
jgi:hypothetical protein